MYATNGLAEVVGIPAEELTGKSFYYCIQENCLTDAIKCLESAKANDSIAYLRFWFRDPRQDDRPERDESMGEVSSADEDDGGVQLGEQMDEDFSDHAVTSDSADGRTRPMPTSQDQDSMEPNSRSTSGNSTDLDGNRDVIFDHSTRTDSSASSLSTSNSEGLRSSSRGWSGPAEIELEAVVSCTSDGLVVILRKARPVVPQIAQPARQPIQHPYANGFFASPWATEPIMPEGFSSASYDHPRLSTNGALSQPTAAQAYGAAAAGPPTEDFMNSIREVAVFAWALTGINGTIAQYGRGNPGGEAQPLELPIWKQDSGHAFGNGTQIGIPKSIHMKGTYGQQNSAPPYSDQSGDPSVFQPQQQAPWHSPYSFPNTNPSSNFKDDKRRFD